MKKKVEIIFLLCLLFAKIVFPIDSKELFNYSDLTDLDLSDLELSDLDLSDLELSDLELTDCLSYSNNNVVYQKPAENEITSKKILEKIKKENSKRGNGRRSILETSLLCILYEEQYRIRINKNDKFKLTSFQEYLVQNEISIKYVTLSKILCNFKSLSEEKQDVRRKLVENSLVKRELTKEFIEVTEKRKKSLLENIKKEESKRVGNRSSRVEGAFVAVLYEEWYKLIINENSKLDLRGFHKYLLKNDISITSERLSNFLRYFKKLSKEKKYIRRQLVANSFIYQELK